MTERANAKTSPDTAEAYDIVIAGVVQGVGMRPFIYRLAREMGICGWVNNTGSGVRIHAEGCGLDRFVRRIEQEKPALAAISRIDVKHTVWRGYPGFEIAASREAKVPDVLISPDLAVCTDCLAEIYDTQNRRRGYAFTNCTNCGPRYTIIRERPYDRARTTMASFALCHACAEEYHNAADRRFHAQPVACRQCGPELAFADAETGERVYGDEALGRAQRTLRCGGIVALKGLGGYHLACDATNNSAVQRLRRRKERGTKPFAVMAKNMQSVREAAFVNEAEAAWLTAAAAPIVLLQRRRDTSLLADDIAPGLDTLGVILPYTPLHDLLMHDQFAFLVLTSANLSGQPLIYRDDEALSRLAGLADAFLYHNREIFHPCDDSVVRQIGASMTFNRRARGYVPLPLALPDLLRVADAPAADDSTPEGSGSKALLAVGADMKNAFCILKKDQAFLSPYLGEMSDKLSFDRFCQEMHSWQQLLHMQPQAIAHDAHPDYATTRWAKRQAQEMGTENLTCEVYHHHAHLVSVMGEHNLERPTLGLIADGTGYGADGRIWGCEVLFGDAASFVRRAHLQYLPLPGGDFGIKYPLRTAYAYFLRLQPGVGWEDLAIWRKLTDAEKTVLRAQIATGIQIEHTSSAGRLFDVMAALLGICYEVTYEAQAAMELENRAWRWEQERRRRLKNDRQDSQEIFSGLWLEYEKNQDNTYDWAVQEAKPETESESKLETEPETKPDTALDINVRQKTCFCQGRSGDLYALTWSEESREEAADVLALSDFMRALWHDVALSGADGLSEERTNELAWKCHASLAWSLGRYLEQTWTDKRLILAGGVFQNKLFTEMLEAFLVSKGWTVYRALQLPPGDGGVAFGQALIGRCQMK